MKLYVVENVNEDNDRTTVSIHASEQGATEAIGLYEAAVAEVRALPWPPNLSYGTEAHDRALRDRWERVNQICGLVGLPIRADGPYFIRTFDLKD